MMTNNVTFLGLGAMGRRMAARLLGAGHPLTVWNRSPAPSEALREAGARVAASVAEACANAEVVIAMVSDDPASRAVWTAALASMRPGSAAIEASTISPTWALELGEQARAREIGLLDAPVIGSLPQVEAGKLTVLAGGDAELLERVRPVLASFSAAQHHVGPQGAGATLKLLVNTMFAAQVGLLGLARRSSVLDPARVLELLPSLPVTSPALAGAAGLIAARRFEPLFPLALVEKDLRYATALASELDASTPLTGVLHEQARRACERGLADENITALAKLFE